MTHFRYYILPHIRRALSILLLYLGLFSVWLALDTPFFSSDAVLQRIRRENYAPDAATVASGPIEYYKLRGNYLPENTWWFVCRSGDQFYFHTLQKVAGFLWRPAQNTLSPRCYHVDLSQSPIPLHLELMGLEPGPEQEYELTPIVVCTDPAVVRVEAQFLKLGHREEGDPQAAMDSRGVSPVFTQVADGVWAAPPILVPGVDDDSGSLLIVWYQGYDADGNLLYRFPSTS